MKKFIPSAILFLVFSFSTYALFDEGEGLHGGSVSESQSTVASVESLIALSEAEPTVDTDEETSSSEDAEADSIPVPTTLPTNSIPASYLSLTNIELRTNAQLDELVADYETNAVALYSYVLNQIDYRSSPDVSDKATKGALGTYLEGEGNSADLSSLTLYLLRRCNIPCAYGFARGPYISGDDTYQIYGYEPYEDGYSHTSVVKTFVYAYVSTNGVSTNWIALVPWDKERVIEEGIEFRDALTNAYDNATDWMNAYLKKTDATIEAAVSNSSDLAMDVLPRYLEYQLSNNLSSTSLDQVGARSKLKEQYITNWPSVSTILVSTSAVSASATLASTNHETVSFIIKRGLDNAVMISNTFYAAELHNRRVLLHFIPATSADQTIVTNAGGFYEAGTNFSMRSVLRLGATPTFSAQAVTGSASVTVRMNADVTTVIDGATRSLAAGNFESYVFDFGRVTDLMLEPHYETLDDLSAYVKANTNLTWSSIEAQDLLGEQACLVGLNYYHLLSQSSRQLQEWIKVRNVESVNVGSFYFKVSTTNTGFYVADSMNVDAFSGVVTPYYLHYLNSGTNGAYRASEAYAQERDYFLLHGLYSSSLEHGILKRTVGFRQALSSCNGLRRTIETGGYVTNFTATSYSNSVNAAIISNVDSTVYSSIRSFFTNHTAGLAWFPSKQVTNGTYAGYGYVLFDVNLTNIVNWHASFLISGNNYGGRSQRYELPALFSSSRSQASMSSSIRQTTPNLIEVFRQQSSLGTQIGINYAEQHRTSHTITPLSSAAGSRNDTTIFSSYAGQSVNGLDFFRSYALSSAANFYGTSLGSQQGIFSSSDYTTTERLLEQGFYDNAQGPDRRGVLDTVADPVDTRTGEFYVDDTDLICSGAKPIAFNRAYSSQYGAVGEFGFGWRFNHSCYLVINDDETEIRAVEDDGTVLALTNIAANTWAPVAGLNDHLANQNAQGIGSGANPFSVRITKSTSTNYTLTYPNGETKKYELRSFVDGSITKQRPYLTRWADANSNALTYTYGTDSNRYDFGRIAEIRNNAHYVKLNYTISGRLREVLTDDGRRLTYEYNGSGDLIAVNRPDGTRVQYEYQTEPVDRADYLSLDGSSDYMQLSRSLTNVQDTFTIECWIRPTDAHQIDTASTSGVGGTNGQKYVLFPEYGGLTNAGVGISVGTNGVSVYEHGGGYMPALLVCSTNLLRDWTHIAVVYSNKTPSLFINGSYAATGYTSTRTHVYPGSAWGGGVYGYFNGLIDQARVWNVARSASDIQETMFDEPESDATGLAGAWTFSERDASDVSTNNNDGTFYGNAEVELDDTEYSTHLITREIKPGGRIVENVYDDIETRRVTEQRATVGLSAIPERNATFSYSGDGLNGSTIISNILGDATRYDYSNGLIVAVTDALGFTESNQWDSSHNLIERVDQRGVITRYAYDSNGNPTNISVVGDLSGSGTITTAITWRTYNANNLVASETTPLGAVTRFAYDLNKNILTQELCYADSDPWNPTNNSVYSLNIYQYNTNGWVTNEVVASGSSDERSTRYSYDSDGNPLSRVIDPGYGQAAVSNSATYNNRGWVTRKTDATGAYSTYDYDAMGRAILQYDYSSTAELLAAQLWTYDENGNVIEMNGPRADVDDSVTNVYDRMDRLVGSSFYRYYYYTNAGTIISAADLKNTQQTYDGFGNLISTLDAESNLTQNAYDPIGRITASTNYEGNGAAALASMRNWYDGGGLVVSNQSPRGYITAHSYNAYGKPTQCIYPDGATETWRYHSSGLVTQYINARGVETDYQYDDFGRLTNKTEAAGTADEISSSYSYDRRNNLTQQIDPQSFTTTFTYDDADRLVLETGPTGTTAQAVWSNRYDGANRLIGRYGVNTYETNAYDGLGRLTYRAAFPGGSSSASYFERFAYDGAGNPTNVIYAGAETNILYYDAQNRLAFKYYDASTIEVWNYDGNGNMISYQDIPWNAKTFEYDGLNRLIAVTDENGVTITNYYDPDGNVTNVAQPLNRNYLRSYDERNRLTSEKIVGSSGGEFWNKAYTYDENGNLLSRTTARGVTVNYTYDNLDRRTGLDASGGDHFTDPVTYAFTYTDNGWLSSAGDGTTTVSRSYDQLGRIVSETNSGLGHTITYDAEGRRSSYRMASPFSESWTNQWDGANRLTNIIWSGGNFRYKYEGKGHVQTLTGSVLSETNTWFSRDRRASRTWRHIAAGLAIFSEDSLTFNGARRLNLLTYYYGSGYETNTLGYEQRGGLTNERAIGPYINVTNRFWLDAAGLRTNFTGSNVVYSLAADEFRRLSLQNKTTSSNPVLTVSGMMRYGSNVLVSVNGTNAGYASIYTNTFRWSLNNVSLANGTNTIIATTDAGRLWETSVTSRVTVNLSANRSYGYDDDGNLVYLFSSNKQQVLRYDALDRLVGVVQRDRNGNGYDWQAQYDALNRRTRTLYYTVTSNTATLSENAAYFYDPMNPVAEIGKTNSSDRIFYQYGVDNSQTLHGWNGIGGLLAFRQSGTVWQVTSDIRGNVASYFAGSLLRVKGFYEAFGGEFSSADMPSFATRRQDQTGLHFFGARYYDQQFGQFTQVDPSGFADSLNLYAYCGNDPINKTDPDGMLAKGVGTGAMLGDYGSYDTRAQAIGGFAGQVGVGFTPVGIAGDVRDFSAAMNQVESRGLSWRTGAGVALAGVAFIPVLGDAAKGIFKPLLKNADGMKAVAKNTTTVIGSLEDVAKFKNKVGYNVLDVPDAVYQKMSPAEFDRLNAEWLNASLRRGDHIMAVTDPAAHAQFLESIRPGLSTQSRYLNLEIPMLKEFGVIEP